MRIALAGLKRGGKDTFGRIAVDGYDFVRLAFADNVKELAKKVFPDEFKDNSKPVELLQWFGNTMRQHDPEVWIKQLDKDIKVMEAYDNEYCTTTDIVITDVRYPNEVEFLRNRGFKIIFVYSPLEDIIARCTATEADFKPELLQHESERMAYEATVKGRAEWADLTVCNTAGIEEYEDMVHCIIQDLIREDEEDGTI